MERKGLARISAGALSLLSITLVSGASLNLARAVVLQSPTSASLECSCVISTTNVNFSSTVPGYAVLPPPLPIPNQPSRNACNNACVIAATPYFRAQSVATAACAADARNGTDIRAYARTVGDTSGIRGANLYAPVFSLGVLIRSPAATRVEWRCPPTWYNGANELGGVSPDRGCKKLAGNLTMSPLPPSPTGVGSWGFTWYNEVWAFGTAANGGAATSNTITTPAVCRF